MQVISENNIHDNESLGCDVHLAFKERKNALLAKHYRSQSWGGGGGGNCPPIMLFWSFVGTLGDLSVHVSRQASHLYRQSI